MNLTVDGSLFRVRPVFLLICLAFLLALFQPSRTGTRLSERFWCLGKPRHPVGLVPSFEVPRAEQHMASGCCSGRIDMPDRISSRFPV